MLDVIINFFQPFFALPFWQQFLIMTIIWMPLTFLWIMFLEFGPLASASPMSGGIGVIFVGIGNFILFVIGGFTYGIWQPMAFLMVPFVAYLGLLAIMLCAGALWNALMFIVAKRFGYE